MQEKDLEKTPSNKNLANISQHSSMSQADDVSSPYARVKSPQHAYDKLKKSKHPYAQVIQPATAGCVAQVENIDDEFDEEEEEEEEDETTIENPISHRETSNNDLLSTTESHLDASAAISGRISASQELPYMTPPIMNIIHNQQPNQHFSGDSQDSSSKIVFKNLFSLLKFYSDFRRIHINKRKRTTGKYYCTNKRAAKAEKRNSRFSLCNRFR